MNSFKKLSYLIAFGLMTAAVSAFAAGGNDIYHGDCIVNTSGHSGADVHILKHIQVKMKEGDSIELYRSKKAIYEVSAYVLKTGPGPVYAAVDLTILNAATREVIASSSMSFTGTVTPPNFDVVTSNLTDLDGPTLSEIACMQ
jgi:hypothetical protein